jgi:hypothetical protein
MLDIIIGFAGWGLRIGKALLEAIVEGISGLGQAVGQKIIDEVPLLEGALDTIGGFVSGGNIDPNWTPGGGSGNSGREYGFDNILSRHTGGMAFRDGFHYLRKGEVVSTPNQAGGGRLQPIQLVMDSRILGEVVVDAAADYSRTNGAIPLHVRSI